MCPIGSQKSPYMTRSLLPALNQPQLQNTLVLEPPCCQSDWAGNYSNFVFLFNSKVETEWAYLTSGHCSLTCASMNPISNSKRNEIVQQQHDTYMLFKATKKVWYQWLWPHIVFFVQTNRGHAVHQSSWCFMWEERSAPCSTHDLNDSNGVKADQADIYVNCPWWLIGGLCFAATLLTSLNLENSCNRTGNIILLQPSRKETTLKSHFFI